MRTFVRMFISSWYLLGWLSHVYLGLFMPGVYTNLGSAPLIPAYTGFWQHVVMPNIQVYALLLAAFEVLVGCLLCSKGKWVKIGLGMSILFNLFLVQMGLCYPAADPLTNFLVNHLPNLFFIALQIPLLWGWDEYSIPATLRNQFSKIHFLGR